MIDNEYIMYNIKLLLILSFIKILQWKDYIFTINFEYIAKE